MAHPQPLHGPVVQPQGLPQHAQVQQTQPQVIVVNVQPTPMTMSSSKKRSLVGLAGTQLVCGAACIFSNIIGCLVGSQLSYIVGQGFWCGLIFVLAGAFGVAGGRRNKQGLIVACLVLSIISACLSPVVFSVAAVGLALDSYEGSDGAAKAMNALLVLFGVLEGIIAIVTSAMSCGVLCCEPTTIPGTVQYISTPGGQVQQTVMIQQPQGPPATYPVTAPYGHNPQQYNASQPPPYTIEPPQPPPYKQDIAPVHQQLQQSGAPQPSAPVDHTSPYV